MEPHSSTLPGQSHGWRSLAGCSPWGRKESDMTERTAHAYWLNGNRNVVRTTILLDKVEFMQKCIKTKKTLNRN